jgi:thiaminase/transcriptional activator TenA
LVLLGAALASADRLRFGRFIGMVSAEENTYFLRAFEAPQLLPTTPYTRSGSRCTTIRIFVGSSLSGARSWTVSVRRMQICAAISVLALLRSNSPPMRSR